MKKFFLFVLTILLAGPLMVSAQECKAAVDEVGKFDGIKRIFYGGKILDNVMFSDKQQILYMYAGSYGDTLLLTIQLSKLVDEADYRRYDETKEDLKVLKGQKLYIVLDNGERVIVAAKSNSSIKKNKILSTYDIMMYNNYFLTKEQLVMLSEHPATDIMIELAAVAPLQAQLKPKHALTFQRAAKCALDRLF